MVGIAQLVEQQVVGLEAEGSTPSIYPIFSSWMVNIQPNHFINPQVNLATLYINFLRKSFPELFITKLGTHRHHLELYSAFSRKTTPGYRNMPKYNPMFTNFMSSEFKLSYKNIQSFRRFPQPNKLSPTSAAHTTSDLKLFTSFKSYLKLNSTSQGTINLPHASFTQFYLGYRRGGLAVLNVSKFYTRWKDVYYLLFNLFYYELEVLTFGSSFFKSELLALNWQSMSRFKFMWRYTKPFLSLRPNKINIYGDFIFYRLNLLGMRVALITDILYHSKTIYYLHRSSFYTLGLVPVNYNLNTVDFAIPASLDSILGQAFFIRFLSLVQQNVSVARYSLLKDFWFIRSDLN